MISLRSFVHLVDAFTERTGKLLAWLALAMAMLTAVVVILRYGFNTGLIWGLEMTSILFSWLVLFGVSYAVKTTANLGVDAVTNIMSPAVRRVMALFAGAICIAYACLLLKGAWDYWANFANLPQTTGRWFPTGFTPTRDQAWYEVVDIPFPEWLRWIEPIMNEGESYEKLPRFIPYVILPIGTALLLFRFVQATVRLMRGEIDSLIVSHEAEDAVDNVKHMNSGD